MVVPHSRPFISEADVLAVTDQLKSLNISSGEVVKAFERNAARYSKYLYGLSTSNGGAAQELILKALGVKKGSSVVIPSYVCQTVRDAIKAVGAEPIYCDSSLPWIMTPSDVARVIKSNTEAVILVHMFGIDASDQGFFDFGIPVIDDLCQAFGLVPAKGRGLAAFTSFHATKCMTTGEGGMAFTNDGMLFEQMKKVASSPAQKGLSDIAAALGISQLERYPGFVERRITMKRKFFSRLDSRLTSHINVSQDYPSFRFPVTVNGNLQNLVDGFFTHDVIVRKGVDQMLHRTEQLPDGDFPGAVSAYESTLSLPFHASLSEVEIEKVLAAADEVLGDE